MPCRIELAPFELSLHIGCTASERQAVQPVRIGFTVSSVEKFPACQTDQLQDTFDVAFLSARIQETALAARVHTLERLGELVEECLRAGLPVRGLQCELTIAKPRYGWTYVHTWHT